MSATARTNDKPRAQAREQGRILLITDDPSVNAVCVARLEAGGFFVAQTAGGAKALIALQRARPHVVITSANLKGVTASELARSLSEAQDAVPFILVGDEPATLSRREDAIKSGAFDYLQLPAETSLLILRASQLVTHKLMIDRLRAEADCDYLTGLSNRRRFRKALGQELERWRRYQIPCALLLLDVDHLKKVNDAHGHPAGDRVIRAVGESLIAMSRDNDTAARLGGEEFALLLAGVDHEKAFLVAERLRTEMSARDIEGVGTVTISLGVAACPVHARTERELFSASDTSLYQAKRDGRDRTVVANLMAHSQNLKPAGKTIGELH